MPFIDNPRRAQNNHNIERIVNAAVKIETRSVTCDLDSDMGIRNVCEKSLLYDSVFSIFLVTRYALWFAIENHGKFSARYLDQQTPYFQGL